LTGQSILAEPKRSGAGGSRQARAARGGGGAPLEETTPSGSLDDNPYMQNDVVLPLVVYGATAVYVTAGLLSILTRPNLYDQIGQGGLSMTGEDGLPGDGLRDRSRRLVEARAEREQDARQMLQARSDRLVRQGRPPLDVDAELARLDRLVAGQSSPRDDELVEEIRQLTIVRNERRARQGLQALDIDAEIERALTELDPFASPEPASIQLSAR
jgi:hypothetical protein